MQTSRNVQPPFTVRGVASNKMCGRPEEAWSYESAGYFAIMSCADT